METNLPLLKDMDKYKHHSTNTLSYITMLSCAKNEAAIHQTFNMKKKHINNDWVRELSNERHKESFTYLMKFLRINDPDLYNRLNNILDKFEIKVKL